MIGKTSTTSWRTEAKISESFIKSRFHIHHNRTDESETSGTCEVHIIAYASGGKMMGRTVNTAVYVTNRVPCALNQFKITFEVCLGWKPKVAHFKVFGAQGYAHIDKSKRSKFDRKAYKCMFMGYFENIKRYRVWNLETLRLEMTRSAKFQELLHLKYVEVVCCDKSMDRMNSMENQYYVEEDMPLERHQDSDDAMKIGEGFDDQDVHAGEDDVNMVINTEMEIPRGRMDGFTGSPTFAPSGPNHLLESEPSDSIVPYEIRMLLFRWTWKKLDHRKDSALNKKRQIQRWIFHERT